LKIKHEEQNGPAIIERQSLDRMEFSYKVTKQLFEKCIKSRLNVTVLFCQAQLEITGVDGWADFEAVFILSLACWITQAGQTHGTAQGLTKSSPPRIELFYSAKRLIYSIPSHSPSLPTLLT
jgi:hypothetical protein